MQHDFIKTGDHDSFSAIQDRNGEVVLAYCRRCRQGEGELESECPSTTLTDERIRALRSEFDPDDPVAVLCNYALGIYVSVHSARNCIARILNARAKETK